MLHTAGNDDELTRPHLDSAVAHLHLKFTSDDQEQLVGVVGVPHELAGHFDKLDRVIVELCDGRQ